MSRRTWPAPAQQLRSKLPAEMRILRGALCLLAGVFILLAELRLLLVENWHLGFGDARLLVSVYLLLVPAVLGILSPLWYWFGRPLWHRFDVLRNRSFRWRGTPQFPLGLLGSALGVALLFVVDVGASFWAQTLAPFGLAVAIASPLWFWLVRPVVGTGADSRLPASLADAGAPRTGRRLAVGLLVLVVASAGLTSVIGLPIVDLGETVQAHGLDVSISNVTVVSDLTDASGEDRLEDQDYKLLLLEVTVENNGEQAHRLPGDSVNEILAFSTACGAQTFGEPANNCNEMYLTGNFTAAGVTYANYDDRQDAIGGELGPDERLSGWLVFRLERPMTGETQLPVTVVVDDVGRWKFSVPIEAATS